MTQGRKPYKKSLKVKSRTETKAKSKARTGGRTRKLRSQRRSRKHKKYPKKKYLGGLHTVNQKIGNCSAHAITRCIYRICRDYEVIIPGTNRVVPKTPDNSEHFDAYVERRKLSKEDQDKKEDKKEEEKEEDQETFEEYKQIEDDQRLVYFTLLPIITYSSYIIEKYKSESELYNILFNKTYNISDESKKNIIKQEEYFKKFNKKLAEQNGISSELSDMDLLNKQLQDFNALTGNLQNKLRNNRKGIHYNIYSLDQYINNFEKIYGVLSVSGEKKMNEIFYDDGYWESDPLDSHSVAITTIKEVENDNTKVKIEYKNTWATEFGMTGHKERTIKKSDIEDRKALSIKIISNVTNEIESEYGELIDYYKAFRDGDYVPKTVELDNLKKKFNEKDKELQETKEKEKDYNQLWRKEGTENVDAIVAELHTLPEIITGLINDKITLRSQIDSLTAELHEIQKYIEKPAVTEFKQRIHDSYNQYNNSNEKVILSGFTVEYLPSDTP